MTFDEKDKASLIQYKCEEIIIKDERGMRNWRISADYTDVSRHRRD